MSGVISFVIAGKPVPWARAGTAGAMRFTPAKQKNFGYNVSAQARRAMGDRSMITGAVTARLSFRLPIPVSWSLVKTAAARGDKLRPIGRPDLDNYIKIVCDSCNWIVYRDDSQITDLITTKRYADRPGLICEFSEISFGVMELEI